MQAVEVIQGTINELLARGSNVLYQKYITTRIPNHLAQKEMTHIKTLCGQEIITADELRSIPYDHQPIPIQRDNLATKQIKKRAESVAKSPTRIGTSDQKKRRLNSRYSTRPTTAAKSMSSTFTKIRVLRQQSKLIKLPQQIRFEPQQNKLENDLRKWKNMQILKQKELDQKSKLQQQKKRKSREAFFDQFNSYTQKNIRTTFGFDGSILPITGHSIRRKIVALQSQPYQINKQKNGSGHASTKKSCSKVSQKPSTQYSKNDIFTSLVYELHSTVNSMKQEGRFYKNDEYNNNNLRQTSHAQIINLKKGVSIYEPLNAIQVSNLNKEPKQSLGNRTATFKHFLLQTHQDFEDSLNPEKSANTQKSCEQQYVPESIQKREMGETRTRIESRDSARFKMGSTNRFSSFCKPMTAESMKYRAKKVDRPRTSNNNGREKIIVEGNLNQILVQ